MSDILKNDINLKYKKAKYIINELIYYYSLIIINEESNSSQDSSVLTLAKESQRKLMVEAEKLCISKPDIIESTIDFYEPQMKIVHSYCRH